MVTIESLKSYQDSPDRLIMLCLKMIIKEPTNLRCFQDVLPPELGDLIASAFRDHAIKNKYSPDQCSDLFKHFKRKHVPINRINFSCLLITPEFFVKFLEEYKGHIDEVDISHCRKLRTWSMLEAINESLRSSSPGKTLILGDTFQRALYWMEFREGNRRVFSDDMEIKKLVMHQVGAKIDSPERLVRIMLHDLITESMTHTLRHLDFSMSVIDDTESLSQLRSLETLILYNCSLNYPNIISTLCGIKSLRALDISRKIGDQLDEETIIYNDDDPKLLGKLISNLPHLTYLDISGTRLVDSKCRNMSAFDMRIDKPFEFLGLFQTGGDAAYRSCIPALKIAGEANETQVLNACEAYIDRPEQLKLVLNELYNYYKSLTPRETYDNVNRALDVVLSILTKHIYDEQIIILTTAALWCVVKIIVTSESLNDTKVRKTITSRLLDVMYYNRTNTVILINGSLTLLFLPDIICEHYRVAGISLLMCRNSDPRTQGFGTTLLNTLACQVGGDQKIFIGKLNAIETMIDIIKSKIEENTCDEILEAAWSTLWNITDETPFNCQRFLDFNGFDAFEKCMDKFINYKEVLRNIMGLLGNVAECKRLRVRFMKERYIKRFFYLLSSHIDGIECSYNACGILAHLLSDGEEFWNIHLPTKYRDLVLKAMRSTIERWSINAKRNINYRSFEPIVRLLETDIVAEAQYWAVFALANLTRINPFKYCPMLEPHDGVDKLRKLAQPNVTEPYVQNLAALAIYQYELFNRCGHLTGMELSSSIDLDEIRAKFDGLRVMPVF